MVTMAGQRGVALPYLRAWRLHRLMTQMELVEKSGVSKTTVVRAEAGDSPVNMANMRKLATALNITPDELVYSDPDAGEGGSADQGDRGDVE